MLKTNLLRFITLMSLFNFFSNALGKNATRNDSSQFNFSEPTFKQNVSEFWIWFEKNADRFYQTIEDGKSPQLGGEVSEAVSRWLKDMAWVFGPGPNKQGHSFTLTPEGDAHRAFLTEYWLKAAPKIPGWTFYSSRQAGEGDLGGQTIKIRDEIFKPEEFWIAPDLDRENECIHITAWHPLFSKLDERGQYQILFLWLDEILGERGTSDWIGNIEINDSKLKQSIPILELDGLIENAIKTHQWKAYQPGETYFGYQMENPSDKFLRADIFTGATTHMRLNQDYFDAEGHMEDPIAQSGASYIFLAFDNAYAPRGQEVDTRGKIEDALVKALESEQSGICLGGATGTINIYIDLLIFDGNRSLKLIIDALEGFRLPKGSALYRFSGEVDTPLHIFKKSLHHPNGPV